MDEVNSWGGMGRRIPSLNQLRAFEAAARHLSFKDAAAELCVTQSAVSHQIRALEEDLGQPLFRRGVREVRLTDRAAPLAAALSEAFAKVGAEADRLRDAAMTGRLRISVAPFYGNRWLLPRLDRFRARHPGLTVEPALSFDLVDLAAGGFDAAVRYGCGDWQGLVALPVHRDVVGPVAAPQYVAGRELPLSLEALKGLRLVAAAGWEADWAAWFAAAGDAAAPEPGRLDLMTLESRAFVFDTALSGNGVCLADIRMTAVDEAAGRLVRLHPATAELAQGIHVVHRAGIRPDPRVLAFADWLREEAEAGAGSGQPGGASGAGGALPSG
ncbi:XRE family transcriptional regulator [Rhodobacteraceae bacterium WD3A24]|nr:XRE family transcriptional regulator [Rhodobacteraceae bacterium WD3A24]